MILFRWRCLRYRRRCRTMLTTVIINTITARIVNMMRRWWRRCRHICIVQWIYVWIFIQFRCCDKEKHQLLLVLRTINEFVCTKDSVHLQDDTDSDDVVDNKLFPEATITWHKLKISIHLVDLCISLAVLFDVQKTMVWSTFWWTIIRKMTKRWNTHRN